MARLNIDRQNELQPKRINTAITQIKSLGLELISQDSTKIRFKFNGNTITFFPYSGWHCGKGINDGRGLQELLKQLK